MAYNSNKDGSKRNIPSEELFRDYYFEEDIAALMGVSVGRLRNIISQEGDHPPFNGRGRSRRFRKDEFHRWDAARRVRGGGKRVR